MKLEQKEGLVSRFLELFYESRNEFTEEGQKDWNEATLDEKVEFIKELAYNQNNKTAVNTLFEYANNLSERMELHQFFKSSKDYREILYFFYEDNIINELEDIITEIDNFGGQFIKDPSQSIHNDGFYITVGLNNQFLAWKFHREFRKGKYYKFTEQFRKEKAENEIITAINEGTFEWDYESLYDLLHSSGFYRSGGMLSDWYRLAALIRTGLLEVSAEECPIPDMPEGDYDDNIFRENYVWAVTSTRGSEMRGLLAYCAWNWLYQLGGKDVAFPTSLCNVRSENLGICVKIGDADPSQMINFIFSQNKTYVHIPYFTTPNILIFKPNERFIAYYNGNKDIDNEVRESFYKIIQIEEEKRKLEEEARKQQFYESCQLKNYDNNASFTTSVVKKILEKDEISPLNGQYISVEKIRSWIKSGELIGFKDDKTWKVKKEDLLEFMRSKKS
jgi:hypothetical protein